MFVLYFALWMIFFGTVTLESILFGLLIAAAVFAFTCAFLGYSVKAEVSLYRKIPDMLHYIYALTVDVIHANVTVLKMIFSADKELEPVLVHFSSDLETPLARAFFADSITLTPGTITVTLENSEYVVHCLDESLAEGLDDSECHSTLKKLESE